MNKKIFLLICILLLPTGVYATDMTYEEAKTAVQEVMQAWYMRGSLRQYNSSKNTYTILRHPEDDTEQEHGYSVCSGFTNDVWMETFGMQSKGSQLKPGSDKGTPSGSNDYNNHAENYLNEKGCKSSETKTGCKGEYVIFFASTDNNKKITNSYYYKNNNNFKNFIKLVQPGDVFAYDGHVLIAYDIKKDANGNAQDVLLLNSVGGRSMIYTKIDGDAAPLKRLKYNQGTPQKNNILDLSQNSPISLAKTEGTIQYMWLSSNSSFVKDGKITCNRKASRCSITRAYYKSGTKAAFNYKITWQGQIDTSLLRTKLPGIFIHKTASKPDNSSIYQGNEITYTIKITNNSNMKMAGKSKVTYQKFYIEENVPGNTTFKEKTYDDGVAGTYNSKTNTVKWTIANLAPGETKILKFTIKINKDYSIIGKTISETGKVYINSSSNIPTGTIKHEVIRTVSTAKEDYEKCYNKMKKAGKTGTALMNETYKCVYPDTWNYSIEKYTASLLNKMIVDTSTGANARIALNTTSANKAYSNMILDSYWGGLTEGSYITLAKWQDSTAVSGYIGGSKRAKTIFKSHFKTGDILIYYMKEDTKYHYTKEKGLYAYMYIDGKFVGVNYNGSSNQRNEFTYTYYSSNERSTKLYNGNGTEANYTFANYQTIQGKDKYVILRPEKVIKLVDSIKVSTKPTKLEYVKGEKLDLSGGKITITNNDGTTSTKNITDDTIKVTGYDKTKLGEQTLTITYSEKTTTLKITVIKKEIESISIKTKPKKQSYFVGESLDLTNGVITVHYNDSTTKDISMKNTSVTTTKFNSETSGEQTITVKYSDKTATFKVQVNEIVISTLTIKTMPSKVVYQKGENLNLQDGILLKKYNNGTNQEVSMTDTSVTISGYNKNETGTQTIQLETEGKRVSLEVVVNEKEPSSERVLDSISISKTPNKTDYLVGESLDLTNGKIKLKYYETEGINIVTTYDIINMTHSGVTVTGFSSEEEGEKTLTVTYGGKTTTFKVHVNKKQKTIKSIKMKKNPKKTEYIQDLEKLDLEGGQIVVTNTDDTEEVIDLSDEEIEILDFDNSKLGTQEIVVLYKGYETTFEVTIMEETPDETIETIKITHKPTKIQYVLNKDTFDPSGIVLTIEYKDGTKEEIKLADHPDEYRVEGFDNSKVGTQNVSIIYKGHVISYNIEIINPDEEEYVPIPDTLATSSIIIKIIAIIMIGCGGSVIYAKLKKG